MEYVVPQSRIVIMTTPDQERAERIGDAVRAYRDRRGLTQDDLADAIGRSTSSVARLEQGKTIKPRRRELAAIAQVLGVTVADLERGAPDRPLPGIRRTTYSGDLDQIGEKLERTTDARARALIRAFAEMADALADTEPEARLN